MIPFLLKFLCVLQSLILNPAGSPPPGANECLIKIILFLSFAKSQACSVACICHLMMTKKMNVSENIRIL